MIDESTSMISSGTSAVEAEELHPLIDALTECGGALGVGFVREAPQPGMVRIDFQVPTALPSRPVQRDGEENYEFDDRVAAYNQVVADRIANNKKRSDDKGVEIDAFLKRVGRLLGRPRAKATDLNSGLNAAEIFLSEPGVPPSCQKYLVVVSDGLDNRRRPLVSVKTDATVLWINSTSPDKVLSRYRPSRAESFPAAVDFIVRSAKKEDVNDANPK